MQVLRIDLKGVSPLDLFTLHLFGGLPSPITKTKQKIAFPVQEGNNNYFLLLSSLCPLPYSTENRA